MSIRIGGALEKIFEVVLIMPCIALYRWNSIILKNRQNMGINYSNVHTTPTFIVKARINAKHNND